MAYTVTKLITNAYHIASIVSREFETVSGSQINIGRDYLDDILGDKAVDNKMVPYWSQFNLNAVIGQEEYFIPNLIAVETFTFTIDTVRYPTRNIDRKRYFGSARANNVNSLPYSWHIEKEVGGSRLFIYFKPDQDYPLEIWGQFGLDETTGLLQDLLLTYDRYYVNYLKYELAERICAEFDFEFPAGAYKTLERYRAMIAKKSAPLDLTLQKRSTLGNQSSLNYGQVNFGRGWTAGNGGGY